MSKNKNLSSSKKYIADDDEEMGANSHFYQNASAIRTRLDRSDNLNENRILASSSSSSQKPLLSNHDKQIDVKYFFLILASVCLVSSLITIAITFIFPFWLNLTLGINGSNPNLPINITNTNNGLILRANTSSNINFYVGLWEVKMDRNLQLYDPAVPKTIFTNSFPQSMLWLNADVNSPNDGFLLKFSQFIDLATSNLFVVQILEILHLIFAMLAFCFTAFTLCLCRADAFCWHLICLILSLLSFLLGATIIGLLVYWESYTTSHVTLVDNLNRNISFSKTYNWCFWAAVGINSALLAACFLILVYVLVAVCTIYINGQQQRGKHSQSKRNKNDLSDLSSSGHSSRNSNELESGRQSRLPRLHPSTRSQQAAAAPLPAFSPAYTDRLMYQSQHIAHVPQPPLAPSSDIASRSSQQNQNAQYIFYTGHGNYQRKSFDTNDPSTNLSPQLQAQPPPAPPNYNDPINAFIGQPQNYNNNNNSLINSRQSSQPQRTSNYHSNGPYINSNIPDAPPNNNNVYNDFRFPSYR